MLFYAKKQAIACFEFNINVISELRFLLHYYVSFVVKFSFKPMCAVHKVRFACSSVFGNGHRRRFICGTAGISA
jgi:hypothetical protein